MMSTEEFERPTEWLRALVEERQYGALLANAGSLGVAAYRLARARCCIQPVPCTVPTLREVLAAARIIGDFCGIVVPPARVVVEECALQDLPLIEPVKKAA